MPKIRYYGRKTTQGVKPFPVDADGTALESPEPYCIKFEDGKGAVFLYKNGLETSAPYLESDSNFISRVWVRFRSNPFAPAKTYKRAANGRFAPTKDFTPDSVVMGQKYKNSLYYLPRDTVYMGIKHQDGSRGMVIAEGFAAGKVCVSYERNKPYWHAFYPI